MSLNGNSNEEKIWNFFSNKGLNDFGIAGLMGNIYAESGLVPTNLQNTYEKSLGYSDSEYTKAVDNGSYKNFVKDAAGYGLCQWTYWSRKQNLLNYAKYKSKSIGDLEMQLNFLYKELSENYSSILSVLKNATSILQASNEVLTKFEKPADQSDSVKTKRANYGKVYYDKFSKKGDVNMEIIKSILTKNPCYTAGRTITVKGLMLHSVGCPQPSAKAFITNWNSPSYDRACVHGFIDANDGKIYQCLPWNHRGWHAGGSANNTHIGVEMCEPSTIKYTGGSSFTCSDKTTAKAAAKRTYKSAVQLFAYLCKQYKLNPLGDGVIISHKEGCARGIASNHGDPEHLWKGLGLSYTMATFRNDVKKAMNTSTIPDKPSTPSKPKVETSKPTKKVTAKDGADKFSKSLAGTYTTTADLNIRSGAGTSKAILVTVPKGTKVTCYGYYTPVSNTKWLYIQFTYKKVLYTGFASGAYLKK